jgi:hypothetical protein
MDREPVSLGEIYRFEIAPCFKQVRDEGNIPGEAI